MDKKTATRAAATFGAALVTLGVTSELQAEIVPLTFNPGYVPWGYGAYNFINEVGASFFQWNDSIGKTMYWFYGNGAAPAQVSQTISPGTFAGTSFLFFSAYATGTKYVAFSYSGNVGWFSFDAAGFGGNITYLEGAYGNAGEAVHVGTVPAPAGLALLALGALGIRRKRSA
jgi:MYXO-CTERM domain-containing protein